MTSWTPDDLLKLDLKYAKEGIPHHQRPLKAALELLGTAFSIGMIGNPEVEKIMAAYAAAVPEVDTTWPGMGIGIAASSDQVRKVTLPIMAGGGAPIEAWSGLGFSSDADWWNWCRKDLDIAAETSFAFADLHDFAYGLDSLQHGNPEALTLLQMAQSNLEDVANTLPATFSVNSVIQPICLVAELALKGALVWEGADPKSFKGSKGHNLTLLASQMATARPHRDDALVSLVISRLPPYVDSRYRPAGLTRLQVVRRALGVQFIAASALRRIAGPDLAAQMETGGWPAPQRPFFPDEA
ncbi:MAG TPA: hypothetical protein VF605_19570 [Allosphingosinicella sp.]|jgi:hypothetical protein